MSGMTLVLMPRFDCERSLELMVEDKVTITLCVPPTLLAYCQIAEEGKVSARPSPALGQSRAQRRWRPSWRGVSRQPQEYRSARVME